MTAPMRNAISGLVIALVGALIALHAWNAFWALLFGAFLGCSLTDLLREVERALSPQTKADRRIVNAQVRAVRERQQALVSSRAEARPS